MRHGKKDRANVWPADSKESVIRQNAYPIFNNITKGESQFLADPMRAFEHKMGDNFSSNYK